MAITVADLKFFQSERMTDNDDGGGRMTATEIVSGEDNQIFDDVSDVDRAAGDVSIRKVYAAVTSEDTDKYLDAGAAVFEAPADPAVTVALFSTGSFYDERSDLANRLEQTIVRGSKWQGYLWGKHLVGMRAITLWQRTDVELPTQGGRLELVQIVDGDEGDSQFLWVTGITDTIRTITDDKGQYLVREVVLEIAEALEYNFEGEEPSRYDLSATSLSTIIYSTRYNSEAVPLYGIAQVVDDVTTGDFTVVVDDLYVPIVPTSTSETALADVNPGGDSPALIGGNTSAVSFTTTLQCIKPDVTLYCGSGIKPGTLSISVSGATITDDNGDALLAAAEIGTVDYGNGLVRWNASCPNYGANSKTVSFQPASRPTDVAETASQRVTAENRGYVWVITLTPIPAPGTLMISYRVNEKWYVLNDLGGGLLTGADSSYGSGTLSFTTGTATFTAGALPDVGSDILYSWGTPAVYTARGGADVLPPRIGGTTINGDVTPGTVSVEWTYGSTYTLEDTDSDGILQGTGGEGRIDYRTGEWWVFPTSLPAIGTEFTIAYHYGALAVSETFTEPTVNPGGDIDITLTNPNVLPGSVSIEWTAESAEYSDSVVEGGSESLTEWTLINPAAPGSWWNWMEATTSGNYENSSGYSTAVTSVTARATDDGDGALSNPAGACGTINYVAGTLNLEPAVATRATKSIYENTAVGSGYEDGGVENAATSSRKVTSTEFIEVQADFPATGGSVIVRYQVADEDHTASESYELDTLTFDLTRGYKETIVAGSVRFTLGNSIYVDTAGQIYRDPSALTGAGSLAGSLDRSTGRVTLSSWLAGGASTVSLESLTTAVGMRPVDVVVFRTPIAPIKSGTMQIRFTQLDGTVKSKTVDGTGVLEDSDCLIRVDYDIGVVRARFGLWKVDADLTPQEKLEPWYDPELRVDFNGTLKIFKPKLVYADSILYNAVATTFLPPDSAMIGLNAARMPPDGRALIFNTGRLALVHHTDTHSENSLSPTQVVDMGRVRLYRVVIDDTDGKRLPATFYSVDRAAGTVTMAADLNLTGYTGPYTFRHTIADLVRLVEVDINGTLTANKALSHDYPKDDSRVSGVLYAGTLQARYTNLFEQSTWTSVWSDEVIGNPPLAQYNDALYPIQVTNEGAYPDRYLIKFTSSTEFQVIGENLGLIAVGDTTQNCSPVNLLTSNTYFTIDYRGWGANWSTGNCLRFNIVGAAYPVDLIRAVQPSDPYGADASVELIFVGNVDA